MDYGDIVLLLLTAFALSKPTKNHADFQEGVLFKAKVKGKVVEGIYLQCTTKGRFKGERDL